MSEEKLIKRCANEYGSISGRYSSTNLNNLVRMIKHGIPEEYISSIIVELEVYYSYGDTDGTPKLMAYYFSPETKEEELERLKKEENDAIARKQWDIRMLDEIAARHNIKVIK